MVLFLLRKWICILLLLLCASEKEECFFWHGNMCDIKPIKSWLLSENALIWFARQVFTCMKLLPLVVFWLRERVSNVMQRLWKRRRNVMQRFRFKNGPLLREFDKDCGYKWSLM